MPTDELTDDERALIKQLGITEQAYIKAKNAPNAAQELEARLNLEAEQDTIKRGKTQ